MTGCNPVLAVGGGRAHRVCMGVATSLNPPLWAVSGMLELSASGDGGATFACSFSAHFLLTRLLTFCSLLTRVHKCDVLTWSPWKTVASQSRALGQMSEVDKPWLLVDGANVYMSYTRFPSQTNSGEGSIEVVTSHYGGASFAAPVVLGIGQGSFFTQAGACGAMFVSYVHNDVAQIATSLDGATFEVVPADSRLGSPPPQLAGSDRRSSLISAAVAAAVCRPPATLAAWSRPPQLVLCRAPPFVVVAAAVSVRRRSPRGL